MVFIELNEGNVVKSGVAKMKENITTATIKNVRASKARKPFGDVNDFEMNVRENVMKTEQDMKISKQVETCVDEKNINDTSVVGEDKVVSSGTSQDTFDGNKTNRHEKQEEILEVKEVEAQVETTVPNDNLPVTTNALEDEDALNVVTSTPMLALNAVTEGDIKVVSFPPISPINKSCHEECDRRTTNSITKAVEPIIEKTYIMDNLNYLHLREKTIILDPNYLKKHAVVNSRKRSILVDWLIEVAERMDCCQNTIFLAVTYIDSFLSRNSIKLQELQLLGVTALMIACKYEEVRGDFLGVSGCIFLTSNMYSRERIYDMELRILTSLRFDVGAPTTSIFMDIFSVLCNVVGVELAVARYIAELSLLEGERTLRFLPSVQAASALLLGSCVMDGIDITELELSKPFGFSLDELKPCMNVMLELYRTAPYLRQRAVLKKYSTKRYHEMSKTVIVS